MALFFHEEVIRLQILVEEECGMVVKTIDLPALARGKPVSFSVRLEVLERNTRDDDTPAIVPLLCRKCSKDLESCRCAIRRLR